MKIPVMELPVKLDNPKAIAKSYRDAGAKLHDDRHKRIAGIAQAIADGRHVVSIRSLMREIGLDKDGFPMLAFAHPEEKSIRWRVWTENSDKSRWMRKESGSNVGPVHLSYEGAKSLWKAASIEARVPIVPPDVAEEVGADVIHENGTLILWDPTWEVSDPPSDPILIRQIDGDFFEVLTQWDLSEVEKLVFLMDI